MQIVAHVHFVTRAPVFQLGFQLLIR